MQHMFATYSCYSGFDIDGSGLKGYTALEGTSTPIVVHETTIVVHDTTNWQQNNLHYM